MSDQKPAPEVITLNSIMDYQEHAVVSRTFLKKDKGNVTVFAFDKEEALSEHTAPHDAMVIILEGQAEVSIAGTPYTLSAGEMIIMPANQPHAIKALSPFKMLLIMIKE